MESLRILIDLYILEKEQSENKRKPFIDKEKCFEFICF